MSGLRDRVRRVSLRSGPSLCLMVDGQIHLPIYTYLYHCPPQVLLGGVECSAVQWTWTWHIPLIKPIDLDTVLDEMVEEELIVVACVGRACISTWTSTVGCRLHNRIRK